MVLIPEMKFYRNWKSAQEMYHSTNVHRQFVFSFANLKRWSKLWFIYWKLVYESKWEEWNEQDKCNTRNGNLLAAADAINHADTQWYTVKTATVYCLYAWAFAGHQRRSRLMFTTEKSGQPTRAQTTHNLDNLLQAQGHSSNKRSMGNLWLSL